MKGFDMMPLWKGWQRSSLSFKAKGTVTAGNSSQTSDGAAALVLMSREKAEALKLKPMATFRSFAVAGVPPEIMGIGPAYAVPKALKKAGLTIKDIGLVELNEAFASQALYVIKDIGIEFGYCECQWWSDCHGPSLRMHRSKVDHHLALRDEAKESPLRSCDDVYRRWDGRCWSF